MNGDFQFANPALLALLLLVPVLLVFHWLRRRRSAPATMTHTATHMVRDLSPTWRIALRPLLTALRLLAMALMVVALARPQMVQGNETIKGEGVDIALALDISGSMASLDFQPQNRLEAAKEVIGRFIERRPYDKIGLVVFASEAFSQAPITLDRQALSRSLEQVELSTRLGLDDGTAIGLGIANAASMLAQSDAKSKVLILLTDGVNNSGEIDPITAAEAARALGIKIYAIGAAKPGQVPVPLLDAFGKMDVTFRESEIDEETLRQVADLTGGQYFRAEDTQGLRAIYDAIDRLEKSKVEIQVFNQYTELMGWLLVPALAILLLEMLLRQTVFRKVP